MRFSHQESVPVEGCDQRRWPGLQRVVRDFQRGPSEQAPAKRHSALGRLTAFTCRDASLAGPWTANPGEKTSMASNGRLGVTVQVVAGIQTLPLVNSVRTSKGRRPCLAAVDR